MNLLGAQERMLLTSIVLSFVLLVVIIDSVLLTVRFATEEDVRSGKRPPLFAESWSLADPWWAGHIVVGVLIMFVGLASLLTKAFDGMLSMPDTQTWLLIETVFVQNVLLTVVGIYYVRVRYKSTVREIGILWPPRRKQLAAGIVAGAVMLMVGGISEKGFTAMAEHLLPADLLASLKALNGVVDASELLRNLHLAGIASVLVFLGIAVVAPVGEEVFFRAFLHNCARQRLGTLWGTLVSAGAFAVVHGGPLLIPAVFPLGILLAIAYDRSGSLWVPITMHMFNNATLMVAMLTVPELVR